MTNEQTAVMLFDIGRVVDDIVFNIDAVDNQEEASRLANTLRKELKDKISFLSGTQS